MGTDGVWRRVRWGNVARLGGLLALAVVVVIWPRLGGDSPRLPAAGAVPVGGGGAGERAPAEEPVDGGEGERGGEINQARGGEGARRKRAGGAEKHVRRAKRARLQARGGEGKRRRGVERPRGAKRARTVERAAGRERPRAQMAPAPVASPQHPVPASRPADPVAAEFGLP